VPGTARLPRASLAIAVAHLVRRDRGLRAIVARHGPPPLWARRTGFATLARILLEQQVSLAAAATMYRRVGLELSGGWTPGAVLAAGEDGLRSRGITRQKARYLVVLAEQVTTGELRLGVLSRAADEHAMAALTNVTGIGPWTASIYLLMALGRPDVWPFGDLALHKALARMRRLSEIPSSDAAARLAMRWAPYRAVAARILWHGYLADRAVKQIAS